MGLKRNVGGLDRLLRAVLGTVLLVVAIGAVSTGRRSIAVIAGAGSVALLINAVTQFCGLNALLGIDTCSRDAGPKS